MAAQVQRLRAQTVVVGSGAGGATVARELARRGQGGADPRGGRLPQARSAAGGRCSRCWTIWATSPPSKARRWSGCSPSAAAPSASAGWPFLRPPGSRSGTASTSRRMSTRSPRSSTLAPLPDRLVGAGAQRIMAAAREEGLDWNPFPHFIDAAECDLSCPKCMIGCAKGAKWTARDYVEEAVAGGARLTTEAHVEEVLSDGGKVTGVRGAGEVRAVRGRGGESGARRRRSGYARCCSRPRGSRTRGGTASSSIRSVSPPASRTGRARLTTSP